MPEEDIEDARKPSDRPKPSARSVDEDASKALFQEAWEAAFGKKQGSTRPIRPEAPHHAVEGERLKDKTAGRAGDQSYSREKRDDSEVLYMPGNNKLVVKEDGSWYLRGAGGPVGIVPQLTMEMRTPQWNELSNGGRVTFYPDRTEIQMPSGDRVAFNSNGIRSVTHGSEQIKIEDITTKPVERSAHDPTETDKRKQLSTGDTLEVCADRQILRMPNGEKLVVSEDGNWYIRAAAGPVGIIPQTTMEMRTPQWNALTNGGRVTFHQDRTEISFANGDKVQFDSEGIISVRRGDKTEVLRNKLPVKQKMGLGIYLEDLFNQNTRAKVESR